MPGARPPRVPVRDTSASRERFPALTWWIGGLALLAVTVGLGLLLRAVGAEGTGEAALSRWVAGHHTGDLDAMAMILGVVAGPAIAPLLLLVAAGLVWLWHRRAAVTLVAVTTAGWAMTTAAHGLVHRNGPPAGLRLLGPDSSSPWLAGDGHTSFIVAIVVATGIALRVAGLPSRPAWLIGVPVVLCGALLRIYTGEHYVGDLAVCAGLAVSGEMLAVAVWTSLPAVVRRWALRGWAEPASTPV